MAERKPLFMDQTEGFSEEMAQADSITLGGLTMGGPINMGDNQITDVPTPTDPDHAVNKAYVDAIAQGLDVHEGVVAKTTAELTSYVAAGTGVGKTLTSDTDATAHNTIDGVLLEVGDRVLVSMQGGDDATGDVDNGVYAVTTLADGAGQALVLTRVTDADTAVAGEMFNGLYVFVTGGTTYENTGWSQVLDIATMGTSPIQFSQFSGAPGFTYDQGLVKDVSSIQVALDTDADAATPGAGGGSSGLEFDADSAAGQLRVAVSPTGGIDRLSDGIGVDLDGTTLALDVGGAGEGLSVKGLPAAFEIGTTAVGAGVTAANLDTLTGGASSDADALHTHDGLASSTHSHAHSATTGQGADDHHNQQHVLTGSDHTESGLTTGHILTATSATTFGWQAATASAEAPKVENTFTTATDAIAVGDPVYANGVDTVGKALASSNATARVLGINRLGAGAAPQSIEVVSHGVAAGVLTGATFNTPYYLQAGGGIGTSLPGGGTRVILIGYALNATDLFVDIKDYAKKAA